MEIFKLKEKKIWVAGHNGMLGRAVIRLLSEHKCELLTVDRLTLDLTNQAAVKDWITINKPEVVIICAAKVGGILANNTYPAEFIYQNLMIESNIINAAFENEVQKLLFLGSSCIYPKYSTQPINETELLSGSLEQTNEWYALAKIAGVKLCQAYRKQYGVDYISAMPTNLYGPYDNFDLETSHVIPALINKAHTAAKNSDNFLHAWGSGLPKREFMHVDDCASAILFLLQNYSDEGHVNIGTGEEVSIRQLAEIIKYVVGFKGDIIFDKSKPDGPPRKLLDTSKLNSLGWNANISLEDGILQTYDWFIKSSDSYNG